MDPATKSERGDARATLAYAFEEAGFVQPALPNPQKAQKRPKRGDKNYGKTRVNQKQQEKFMDKQQVEGNNKGGDKAIAKGVSVSETAIDLGKKGAKLAGGSALVGAFGFLGYKAGEAFLGLFGRGGSEEIV